LREQKNRLKETNTWRAFISALKSGILTWEDAIMSLSPTARTVYQPDSVLEEYMEVVE
jgi:hypothetical protein